MTALLQKLLPLDRMLSLATRFGLLKKPLQLLAAGYTKAQGAKTQVLLVLAGLTEVAAALGFVPHDVARQTSLGLLGAAVPTALEKITRVLAVVDQAQAAVKAEADAEAAQKAAQPPAPQAPQNPPAA